MAARRRSSHGDTLSEYRWTVAAQRTPFCIQRGRNMFCTGLRGAMHGSCPAPEAARWSNGVHTVHRQGAWPGCQVLDTLGLHVS